MNVREQAYGTNKKKKKCQMSMGQQLCSPPLLDIARLTAGFSLVWCPKTNKNLKYQRKQKAGVPVKSTDTNIKEKHKIKKTVLALMRVHLLEQNNNNKKHDRCYLSFNQWVLYLFPLTEKKTK